MKKTISIGLLFLITGCDVSMPSESQNITLETPKKSSTTTIQNTEEYALQRAKEKAKIEAEIYAKLKSLDTNTNLLSVQVIDELYTSKIKLFYDESLISNNVTTTISLITTTASNVAKKNNLITSTVEIFINNKSLKDVIAQRDKKREAKYIEATNRVKTKKEISNIESEIYSELKKFDRAYYRSILGGATTDEEIADYANVNLLAVKIVCDTHVCKIRLMYDESLLKASVFENFSEPVYSTAYYIARKYKLKNSEVEFYVHDKSFNGN